MHAVTSVISDSVQPYGLYSLPAVYEILQARILEWVAFSGGIFPTPKAVFCIRAFILALQIGSPVLFSRFYIYALIYDICFSLTHSTLYNRLQIHPHHFNWLNFLFMAEQHSTVYMYYIFPTHSFVVGHWGCFHVLAIVNRASKSTGVYVSFWVTISSRYMPSSGMFGSYGNSIFSFLRNLCTILHNGCTSLQSPWF